MLAIQKQGGIVHGDTRLVPDILLTGRNADKLATLAAAHDVEKFTTDLDAALSDPAYQIFFDASGTPHRIPFLKKAIAAGKHVYCEKPTAGLTADALGIATKAEAAGVKNGTVQDKLWMPSIRKFVAAKEQGFFGDLLSVRGEFGYWVFTGHSHDQPAQRPSWNYRNEDGGGIIIDMHCHWRYVIDSLAWGGESWGGKARFT